MSIIILRFWVRIKIAMKEKIKVALKKLGLVSLGAIIGLGYFIAIQQYIQIKGF